MKNYTVSILENKCHECDSNFTSKFYAVQETEAEIKISFKFLSGSLKHSNTLSLCFTCHLLLARVKMGSTEESIHNSYLQFTS